jgi:hypothetical protein
MRNSSFVTVRSPASSFRIVRACLWRSTRMDCDLKGHVCLRLTLKIKQTSLCESLWAGILDVTFKNISLQLCVTYSALPLTCSLHIWLLGYSQPGVWTSVLRIPQESIPWPAEYQILEKVLWHGASYRKWRVYYHIGHSRYCSLLILRQSFSVLFLNYVYRPTKYSTCIVNQLYKLCKQ